VVIGNQDKSPQNACPTADDLWKMFDKEDMDLDEEEMGFINTKYGANTSRYEASKNATELLFFDTITKYGGAQLQYLLTKEVSSFDPKA
jgi:hypothetical protein